MQTKFEGFTIESSAKDIMNVVRGHRVISRITENLRCLTSENMFHEQVKFSDETTRL